MEAGTSMPPEPERASSSLDIGLNDFQILGALGYGGSSEVFLVRRSKAETLHAMKMIAKKMLGPRAV